MEENKYYVPQLEEYHNGFRFEIYYNTGWEKKIFGKLGLYSLGDIEFNFPHRVKYLDKNDIEELGWRFDIQVRENVYRFKLNTYIMLFIPNKHLVRIKGTVDDNRFEGYIKNYNNLRQLMQQLNIIENNGF